jgi:hypothetical protein
MIPDRNVQMRRVSVRDHGKPACPQDQSRELDRVDAETRANESPEREHHVSAETRAGESPEREHHDCAETADDGAAGLSN